MAFALRPGIDLGEEIRRVGLEQTARAVAEISSSDAQQLGIHEARKCLKRLRALLRFARPGMDPARFAEHDCRIRDIGRRLSATRDWQAMVESLEKLEDHFGSGWNSQLMGGLRATFQGRCQRGDIAMARLREEAAQALGTVQGRLEALDLESSRLSVAAGAEPVYARAQKGLKRAYAKGDADAFHAWRRDAQRHWRHMQLLTAAWPEEMSLRIAKARALSQSLGDDHDIHILLGHVRNIGPDLASWREMERFYDGCIVRQHGLRLAARNHGGLLFAERPGDFVRRLNRYWRVAADRFSHGAHLPAKAHQDSKVVPIQSARAETDWEGPPALIRD